MQAVSARSVPVGHATRSAARLLVRALGIVPLALFALTAFKHAREGHLYDLLWMCNVANLVVGAALISGHPTPLRVGAIWIACGTAFWSWDAVLTGLYDELQVFSHFATLAIAVYGTTRADRAPHAFRALPRALVALLALQSLSHVTTPAMANVNFAFTSYYGLWAWFPADGPYTPFWLALSVTCVLTCAAGEWMLVRATEIFSGQTLEQGSCEHEP